MSLTPSVGRLTEAHDWADPPEVNPRKKEKVHNKGMRPRREKKIEVGKGKKDRGTRQKLLVHPGAIHQRLSRGEREAKF